MGAVDGPLAVHVSIATNARRRLHDAPHPRCRECGGKLLRAWHLHNRHPSAFAAAQAVLSMV